MWQALINLCTSNASQSYWSAIAGESETEPWMRQKATNIFAAEADLSTQRASCTSSNPASSAFWTWTYGKTPVFFLKLALTRWNYGSLVCSVAATSVAATCMCLTGPWAVLWPAITLREIHPNCGPWSRWAVAASVTLQSSVPKYSHPFTHFCFSLKKKTPIHTSLWICS